IVSKISGAVFNDVDGMSDNQVDGTGLSGVTGLNVVLVDTNTNKVVAVSGVSTTDGSYQFDYIFSGSYNIILTTANPAVGDPAPAANLPLGWANSGEHLGLGNGDDGNVDGILSVTISGTDVADANFGINQPL